MSAYQDTCPACKRAFTSYDAAPTFFCSVGCQCADPPPCPVCGAGLREEHAHAKCDRCGYLTSCCSPDGAA